MPDTSRTCTPAAGDPADHVATPDPTRLNRLADNPPSPFSHPLSAASATGNNPAATTTTTWTGTTMTPTAPTALSRVTPRCLAGAGDEGADPALAPLRNAGWRTREVDGGWITSHPHDEIHVAFLPELDTRLTDDRLAPLWTVSRDGAPGNSWRATFSAEAPVEIVAAVTSALACSTPRPDDTELSNSLGWATSHGSGHSDTGAVPSCTSPDGLVRISRHAPGRTDEFWEICATLGIDGPCLWRATVSPSAPVAVVGALAEAVASPAPLERHRIEVPAAAIPFIVFTAG